MPSEALPEARIEERDEEVHEKRLVARSVKANVERSRIRRLHSEHKGPDDLSPVARCSELQAFDVSRASRKRLGDRSHEILRRVGHVTENGVKFGLLSL